ncbi:hypothetical protein KIW84_062820 [Lathyrus oleraceus]|uniref:HTH three-helical bundle domain-containing protein n=2 Tax=Pisum sativum TaxID=3888 RepID=A0A9D4W601_PEA|nr:hypothetical protein KIW84_062820 [Pisum sativum]
MSSFPNSEELTVASAMILLHTKPRFHSSSDYGVPGERKSISCKRFKASSVSTVSNRSSASSSVLIMDDSSDQSEEMKSYPVSFFSATHRYHQMKFKIARKIRSKVMWSSSSCSVDRKVKTCTTTKISPASASGEATSCLSTTSSSRSLRYANRSRSASGTENVIQRNTLPSVAKNRVKPVSGTPHLRRRSEAILKFLSHGGSSEVRIRQMLGDSPDTSKALRM